MFAGHRDFSGKKMITSPWSLRRLHTLDDAQIDGLADVLIDCVEGGASVSFMSPLTREAFVPPDDKK